MDFIKKKVREFQDKKLCEIISKIQFHQHMKNQLEQKLDYVSGENLSQIYKEIESNDKMIKIWQKNEEKLRKQISEMDD